MADGQTIRKIGHRPSTIDHRPSVIGHPEGELSKREMSLENNR